MRSLTRFISATCDRVCTAFTSGHTGLRPVTARVKGRTGGYQAYAAAARISTTARILTSLTAYYDKRSAGLVMIHTLLDRPGPQLADQSDHPLRYRLGEAPPLLNRRLR